MAKRRNVFDELEMEMGSVRVGKKQEDASTALRDRVAVAALKADILRRTEAISDSEDKEQIIMSLHMTRMRSDDDSEAEGEDEEPARAQDTQTILKLAYIADPAVFSKDEDTKEADGPMKDQILQKHEFAGNQLGAIPSASSSNNDNNRGSRGGSSGGLGGQGGRGGGGGGRGGRGGSLASLHWPIFDLG
ncbi:hypothetical protein DXG01_002418 [Tephrocybe rancida]|nr:hypothetical protein DXG01_002418 [Tephrocybe rancida]